MKSYTLVMIMTAALAGGCGGSGSPTNPSPFPTAAGSWTGSLLGPSRQTYATVRVRIEQSDERPTGQSAYMQRVFGTWNGSNSSAEVSGNFTGGVGTDGLVIFTLETFGQQCNVNVNARVSGNQITGTFSRFQPNCTSWLPDPESGTLELNRE